MTRPCKRCGDVALCGNTMCLACWRAWWESVCALSAVRVQEAKSRKRETKGR